MPSGVAGAGMQVDRRDRDVGVAEGFLHDRQRRPAVDAVVGMGMPQPMRREGGR
jgi:hypothetical protein